MAAIDADHSASVGAVGQVSEITRPHARNVVTLRVRLDFIDLALFFDPDVWLRPGLRVFV